MKISNYVPDLYKNNINMNNIINSEEKELESRLKLFIDKEYTNSFIKTCDIEGLRKFRDYIMPSLHITEDNIEYCRNLLISKIAILPIITYKWLEESLTSLVGKNNFKMYMDYNNYTLYIDFYLDFTKFIEEYKKQLRQLLPANIAFTVGLYATGYIKIGRFLRETDFLQYEENLNTLQSAECDAILGGHIIQNDYLLIS